MEFIKLDPVERRRPERLHALRLHQLLRGRPAHTLETVLWAEADRMKGLAIDTRTTSTNQQGVVKNEVKVNVLNQPYGGFPWIDMPHGRQHQLVQRAQLLRRPRRPRRRHPGRTRRPSSRPTTRRTTRCSWSSGDFDPAQTLALGQEVLRRDQAGELPAAARPHRAAPDRRRSAAVRSRPRWRPAPRWPSGITCRSASTPEYYAMGLIDQILLQGDDSRLYQALVQKSGLYRRRERRHQLAASATCSTSTARRS